MTVESPIKTTEEYEEVLSQMASKTIVEGFAKRVEGDFRSFKSQFLANSSKTCDIRFKPGEPATTTCRYDLGNTFYCITMASMLMIWVSVYLLAPFINACVEEPMWMFNAILESVTTSVRLCWDVWF